MPKVMISQLQIAGSTQHIVLRRKVRILSLSVHLSYTSSLVTAKAQATQCRLPYTTLAQDWRKIQEATNTGLLAPVCSDSECNISSKIS